MLVVAQEKSFVTLDALTPFDPYSIERQVGNTPLLDLSNIAWRHGVSCNVTLYAKAEWYNRSSSIQARAALHILRVAEHQGLLHRGMTIADATSGNMGVAYAMLGAARGYRVMLTVPANVRRERIQTMRAYGADIILTDPMDGMNGAIAEIKRLSLADPSLLYIDQYSNPANWQAHYWTTAPEIWAQTAGRVTHFVAPIGTGGTFVGTARRLKQFNRHVRAVAIYPDHPFHGLEGWRHANGMLRSSFYDHSLVERRAYVRTESAEKMAQELTVEHGIAFGPSSGGAVAAAINVARTLDSGVVVTTLAGNGQQELINR